MIIDTHCHLNFSVFKKDVTDVVRRMIDRDMRAIVVGSQNTTSERACNLAEQYPDILYAAVALHPVHLFSMDIVEEGMPFRTRAEEFDEAYYSSLAKRKSVVAIGECGLDYHQFPESVSENECKKKQKEIFVKHAALAKKYNLPLIVHCRPHASNYTDAYEDMFNLLQETQTTNAVLHAFATHPQGVKKFFELGCMISFTGLITYPELKILEDVVRYVPLDRMMVETDAPYMAPQSKRGTRNEPMYITEIVEAIARLQKVSVVSVEGQTTDNAIRFFHLPK
jgi:TatD DNase family protein